MRILMVALTIAALGSTGAQAAETVTYSYDAKGRLISVQHAGGSQDGAVSTYSFDRADNRTQTQTSGGRPPIIVVPTGGLQVISVSPSPN